MAIYSLARFTCRKKSLLLRELIFSITSGSELYWSFPKYPSHLDHILITNELFDDYESPLSLVETFQIEKSMNGGWPKYEQYISDHRPVGLRIGF